jgi:hypothetical protein
MPKDRVMRVSLHVSLALDAAQELERLATEQGQSQTAVLEALIRAAGLLGKPVSQVPTYTTTGSLPLIATLGSSVILGPQPSATGRFDRAEVAPPSDSTEVRIKCTFCLAAEADASAEDFDPATLHEVALEQRKAKRVARASRKAESVKGALPGTPLTEVFPNGLMVDGGGNVSDGGGVTRTTDKPLARRTVTPLPKPSRKTK